MTIRAAEIATTRLLLLPLGPADADDLFAVLSDHALHRFTGGRPDTIEELRARLEGWSSERSPDGESAWLNWVIRTKPESGFSAGSAIGSMQATVALTRSPVAAEVAWVVGTAFRGRGFASEAARALVTWLAQEGVQRVDAHVHPEHAASAGVAHAAGLQPTDEMVGGEVIWRLTVATVPGAG